MSKPIKFKLIPSSLERLDGKYTASVLSNGSWDISRIAHIVSENRPAIDEADAALAINALAAEMARQIALGNTVATPIGNFGFTIKGSVDSMDAPLTPAVNPFETTFTSNKGLDTKLAHLSPRIDTESLGVKIMSIEDAATRDEAIHGTTQFIMTGKGLSASQTGESLALVADDDTVLSAVTLVNEDGKGQRLKGTLANGVAAGIYRLRLTTRGYGNSTGDLITLTKNVTVRGS